MQVLMVSSEVEPFAKTGGLADVSAALPKALKQTGVTVKTVLPLYSGIDRKKHDITPLYSGCCVHMGTCEEWYAVHHTKDSAGNDIYFIEFDKYFNRPGFYHEKSGEYGDNAYRFSFFCRAAMQLSKDIGFSPDVIHCNDWQTALIPYYLRTGVDSWFAGTKSVFTIHNIGYQGIFDADATEYAGIRYGDFHAGTFESFGKLNLLKGGISYADHITTVSPTYAKEILTPEQSSGMHPLLLSRKEHLTGILNGIDTTQWNPSVDTYIPEKYSVDSWKKGKAENKKALQKTMGLKVDAGIPLFAFIGRFAWQKGIAMLQQAIPAALSTMKCQFCILGSGEAEDEAVFHALPEQFAGQAGVFIGYNERIAHLIEAGSDFFVMPSLYEPCGLNQMYSLAYGTLPVVRATGGLDDTVINYNEQDGSGNGFKFWSPDGHSLLNTIGWAVSTYYDRPHHIRQMVENAMRGHYGWDTSAAQYASLYHTLTGK